jgi:paraquat-inducible protein B
MTPSGSDHSGSDPSPGDQTPAAGDSYPTAAERTIGRGPAAWLDHWGLRATRMWWLTTACAVIALLLVASAWHSFGPRVTIEFVEGHGLRPGDAVRLRGIDVGVVERVVLNPALDRVEVTAQLMQEAAAIAREGTLFWIERPQVGLSAVRGLDTVVGPKYIAAQPGPADGPRQQRFVGVESPREILDSGQHSLEVTLESDSRHSLQTGSPLIYRGVPIGRVTHVGLASDSASVETRLYE